MVKVNSMEENKTPPVPKSEKAKRTRQKILDAAKAVFLEQGFLKATAEEISNKAEVGYGTFYLYFTDKRQAMHTILSEVNDKLYELGETEKTRQGLGPLVTIKAIIRSFFDSFKENVDVLKIFNELAATDPDFKAQHDEVRARLVNRIKEHILKGAEIGNVRQVDPEIAAISLSGLIESIAIEWFFNNRNYDKEKVIETVSKLYYYAIIK